MQTIKNKQNINGWLVINKPKGVNSTRVVSIVKRYFNAKKVGHAGTLDPLADGVLPIALGEATKTINYAMDSDKEYIFTLKWGEETSTCDMEGEVVATSNKIPTKEEILAVLPEFVGDIDQVPPVYSAIKVDGKRAYDLARSGVEVVLKSRKVSVYSIEMLEADEMTATFLVKCGKGTYIRSMARDIAEKLGTKGHVIRLTRTKVGKFCINNAILLESFENSVYKPDSLGLLLRVDAVLDDIPVLTFNPEEARALRQGKQVSFAKCGLDYGAIAVIKAEEKLLALGIVCDGYIKAVRVFNI